MVEFVFRAISEILNLFFLFNVLFGFRVEHKTLLINHILKYFFCRLEVIPLPIKGLFTNRLLLVVMKPIKIRMT